MATHRQNPALGCVDCESLLVDLLEGTLPASQAAQVQAHVDSCTACSATVESARRGHAWLRLLKEDDEDLTPPSDLVARILARTSAPENAIEPAAATPAASPWHSVNLAAVRGRSWYQPRLLLMVAMALFSVTLTMNVAGIRAVDLKPGNLRHTITRQYYSANARVARYSANLKVVYEVESRVREFRRAAEEQPSGNTNGTQPTGQPQQKKARGKDGSLLRPSAPDHRDGVAHGTSEPSPQYFLDARLTPTPVSAERSEA